MYAHTQRNLHIVYHNSVPFFFPLEKNENATTGPWESKGQYDTRPAKHQTQASCDIVYYSQWRRSPATSYRCRAIKARHYKWGRSLNKLEGVGWILDPRPRGVAWNLAWPETSPCKAPIGRYQVILMIGNAGMLIG
jgi:hypothetical protein